MFFSNPAAGVGPEVLIKAMHFQRIIFKLAATLQIKFEEQLSPHQHSCKNSTNLQTWFGGRLWPDNEEGFVDSAPIPFSWGSGNQLMNRFLKTEASLKVLLTVLRYPSAGAVGID